MHLQKKRNEIKKTIEPHAAADMIGDLKTAHLLRSSPKAMFWSQLCGAIVSIFMAAGVYVVFSTAYPCINDLTYTTCSFPTPDVQSWRVRFLFSSFFFLFFFKKKNLWHCAPTNVSRQWRSPCRPRRCRFHRRRGTPRSDWVSQPSCQSWPNTPSSHRNTTRLYRTSAPPPSPLLSSPLCLFRSPRRNFNAIGIGFIMSTCADDVSRTH